MANEPIGNNFMEGVLGVVRLNFNGIDLGKTIDEVSIEWIEDIKDIFFAQDGTQPADKIPTGQAYQVTCKIGENTLARLQQVLRGVNVVGNNAKFGADLYRSGKDNFSFPLIITRVNSDGVASTNPLFRAYCYKAFPMVNGPIGAFGPDTQRETEVVFYLFRDDTTKQFFYTGYASSLGL